ncbi:MAG: NADH-quinone oxidoreductase subunit N, partial [Candidatus Hydrogenedentes bacterium]|nr:NADH-quinone oxidoreductase subunit N [Candidatus Hydrogenedentota bacterium]
MPPGQANSFLPILLVAAGACAVIVADMLAPLSRSRRVSGLTALAAVLAALAALLADMGAGVFHGLNYRFSGMLAYDTVSTFLTLVFLCGAAAVILFALRSGETAAYRQGEFYALLLGAVLGAILLVTANHLVLFVLGIETLSMCSYVLAGFLKDDRNSAEASLKYLIYGAVVSGILFFGLSYLYGLSGTLEVKQIGVNMAARVQSGETGLVFLYALGALLLAGLGFKMALVPFHFWCPDVYQGA